MPARLRARAEAMLDGIVAHPVMRALWPPRLREAIDWIADEMPAGRAGGRDRSLAPRRGARRDRRRHAATARSTGSTGWPTARWRSSTTRPASRRSPSAVAAGYRDAARPARADRRARRLRGRRGHAARVRILVAGAEAMGSFGMSSARSTGRQDRAHRSGRLHRHAARSFHPRPPRQWLTGERRRSPPSSTPNSALWRLRPADAARRMVWPRAMAGRE